MTRREKMLAMAVGGLVAVMGVMYLLNTITEAYSSKDARRIALKSDITKQERTITFGKLARRELEELIEKSLPSDRLFARSEYQSWLLELADDKVDFDEVKVNPQHGREIKRSSGSGPSDDPLFFQHSFLVSGKGSVEQLVEFMFHFYQADLLHRIRQIDLQPITTSRLTLSITVEAISLAEAPPQKPINPAIVSRLARNELQEYVDKIAHRNPFSEANKSPSIASMRRQTGHRNAELSFTVSGNDPENTKLVYSLIGDPPSGARINPSTGLFRWTPTENGNYEVTVQIADGGMPQLTAELTIPIEISDAPVKVGQPSFDPATIAQVTGITESGNRRELWVSVHTENRVLILREGDEIEVGTVKGTVSKIEAAGATIETANGEEITVRLGKNLVEVRGS